MIVFDSSWEQEVVHEDSERRVVLILDIWHPDYIYTSTRILRVIDYHCHFCEPQNINPYALRQCACICTIICANINDVRMSTQCARARLDPRVR